MARVVYYTRVSVLICKRWDVILRLPTRSAINNGGFVEYFRNKFYRMCTARQAEWWFQRLISLDQLWWSIFISNDGRHILLLSRLCYKRRVITPDPRIVRHRRMIFQLYILFIFLSILQEDNGLIIFNDLKYKYNIYSLYYNI